MSKISLMQNDDEKFQVKYSDRAFLYSWLDHSDSFISASLDITNVWATGFIRVFDSTDSATIQIDYDDSESYGMTLDTLQKIANTANKLIAFMIDHEPRRKEAEEREIAEINKAIEEIEEENKDGF